MPFPTNEHPPPKWLSVVWIVTWIALAVICSIIVEDADAFLAKLIFLVFVAVCWAMALIGVDYYKEASK